MSSPLEGVALVREVQESGKALETLEKWRTLSQEEKAKEETMDNNEKYTKKKNHAEQH